MLLIWEPSGAWGPFLRIETSPGVLQVCLHHKQEGTAATLPRRRKFPITYALAAVQDRWWTVRLGRISSIVRRDEP